MWEMKALFLICALALPGDTFGGPAFIELTHRLMGVEPLKTTSRDIRLEWFKWTLWKKTLWSAQSAAESARSA
jgi:hypothetical protein